MEKMVKKKNLQLYKILLLVNNVKNKYINFFRKLKYIDII